MEAPLLLSPPICLLVGLWFSHLQKWLLLSTVFSKSLGIATAKPDMSVRWLVGPSVSLLIIYRRILYHRSNPNVSAFSSLTLLTRARLGFPLIRCGQVHLFWILKIPLPYSLKPNLFAFKVFATEKKVGNKSVMEAG